MQTPAGDTISRISETLQVAENLAEGELLGFELLRTHAGRGADTYVSSSNPKALGQKPMLQTLRKGGNGATPREHVYLRFDLSKSEVPKDAFDRSVLLLSVQPGGLQGESVINVYGIESDLDDQWKETGKDVADLEIVRHVGKTLVGRSILASSP